MRRSLAVAVILLCAAASRSEADAYLRVIGQQAPVRSGPSGNYREVYVAQRGQVFQVIERGSRDYWFKVELDDGTAGWILGDLVFPFEVGEDDDPGAITRMGRAIRRTLLGPSPLPYADIGLSFSAGVLDMEGIFLLRPSWIIDPYWSLEGFGGLNPRSEKDVFMAGFGFLLRLMPGAVVGPYAGLSIGAAYLRPKADNVIDQEETLMALGAGGGFEITFKKQITLRLDVRNWTFFDQNQSTNALELTAGLAIFF